MTYTFDKSRLTATEYSSVEDKLKFCKQFVKFFESDYEFSKFPKWFYVRLSMTFGNIAHYNQHGFYETWFSTPDAKARFINNILEYPCYGNPAFAYCDAEKMIIEYLESVLTYKEE